MQIGAVQEDEVGRFGRLALVRIGGVIAAELAVLGFAFQLLDPLPLDDVVRVW